MPFFGLVCIASWVGCFFPSSQDLLTTPNYSTTESSTQLPSSVKSCLQCTASAKTIAADQPPKSPFQTIASTLNTQQFSERNPLGLLQSLFSEMKFLTVAARAAVRVTPVDRPLLPNQSSSSSFGRCAATSSRSKGFYVNVNDAVVAETHTRQQAIRIGRQLEKLLSNPTLDAEQIYPANVKGLPAVKIGDRVLFVVDSTIASRWNCNSERLAIHWVNTLRSTLGATPISFTNAQATLHQLQATGERLEGLASWYGPYFHGRQTATGETFDENAFTAAHPSLPFDTFLKVTNRNNGKSVIVRVNDRGPYFENRMLDLSREAARSLESESVGVVPIEAEILQPAPSLQPSGQTIARL